MWLVGVVSVARDMVPECKAVVLRPSASENRRFVSGYLLRCDPENVEIRRL